MSSPRSRLLPVLILLTCLAGTAGGARLAAEYVRAESSAVLQAEAIQLETELANRVAAYAQVLYGGVALFAASNDVTREDWRIYVGSLGLERRFPGFQGVAYSVLLPDEAALASHVAQVRAEGFPDFAVRPEGEREVYSSIVYIEPFDTRNQRAFGYDMFTEPTRREAMERARDTGEPALSGRVRLLQENGTDVQPGFLLYVPVYAKGLPLGSVEERRAALQGWVYAPFRARDFMTALDTPSEGQLHFTVHDGATMDPASLLFVTPGEPGPGEARVTRIALAGHQWTLVERPAAGGATEDLQLLPAAVLLAGLVVSGLVFWIAWTLAATRERAVALAASMTSELRARTSDLEASNQALRQFNYVVTHDLKEPVRGIDVYLAVLAEDHREGLDEEARSLVTSARAASARLTRLLGALLELSRADRAHLSPVALDPREVLESEHCRAAYDTLARERRARLEVGEVPPVLASHGVLAQALGNVVANAIHHNGSPEPVVRVRGRRVGQEVELTIEDNGEGFPPEVVATFASGELQTRGFGLLLARQSVERLGGRMEIGRSTSLSGALVRFILPAAAPPPSAQGSGRAGRLRTRGSSSASQ